MVGTAEGSGLLSMQSIPPSLPHYQPLPAHPPHPTVPVAKFDETLAPGQERPLPLTSLTTTAGATEMMSNSSRSSGEPFNFFALPDITTAASSAHNAHIALANMRALEDTRGTFDREEYPSAAFPGRHGGGHGGGHADACGTARHRRNPRSHALPSITATVVLDPAVGAIQPAASAASTAPTAAPPPPPPPPRLLHRFTGAGGGHGVIVGAAAGTNGDPKRHRLHVAPPAAAAAAAAAASAEAEFVYGVGSHGLHASQGLVPHGAPSSQRHAPHAAGTARGRAPGTNHATPPHSKPPATTAADGAGAAAGRPAPLVPMHTSDHVAATRSTAAARGRPHREQPNSSSSPNGKHPNAPASNAPSPLHHQRHARRSIAFPPLVHVRAVPPPLLLLVTPGDDLPNPHSPVLDRTVPATSPPPPQRVAPPRKKQGRDTAMPPLPHTSRRGPSPCGAAQPIERLRCGGVLDAFGYFAVHRVFPQQYN